MSEDKDRLVPFENEKGVVEVLTQEGLVNEVLRLRGQGRLQGRVGVSGTIEKLSGIVEAGDSEWRKAFLRYWGEREPDNTKLIISAVRLARWLCSPGAVTEIRACIVLNSDPTDEAKQAAIAVLNAIAQHALEEVK